MGRRRLAKKKRGRIPQRRMEYIALHVDLYDDLPDGAFLAALLEAGIDPEELVEYTEQKERDER